MSNTPLHEIALMDFNQLSAFVERVTNKKHYIANPSEANDIDCDVCAEQIINIVIMPALRNKHLRVNSRSHRLTSDYAIAQMLGSAALTYWIDHGFIVAQNARVSRAISAKIIEEERAEAKAEIQEMLMDRIGVMIQAKPAHIKHGIQSVIDWEETELVAQKMMNYEGFACKHSTLEVEVSFLKDLQDAIIL